MEEIESRPFVKELNEFLCDMKAAEGIKGGQSQIGLANKRMLGVHALLQEFQERPETMLATANFLSFMTGEQFSNSMSVIEFIYNEKNIKEDEILEYIMRLKETEEILGQMKEVKFDLTSGETQINPIGSKS